MHGNHVNLSDRVGRVRRRQDRDSINFLCNRVSRTNFQGVEFSVYGY